MAADLSRPAAVSQLKTLGRQIGVPVFDPGDRTDPVEVAREGVSEARLTGRDTVIVDTAGRLHFDDDLMREVRAVTEAIDPREILFVADAMTGQDAVRSAAGFAAALPLTGIILTKTDGDARGGAALSVVTTVGKPIKFVGVGREARGLRAVPPGPDGVPDPRPRRRAHADREGRSAGGRERGRPDGAPGERRGSSRSRTCATSSRR